MDKEKFWVYVGTIIVLAVGLFAVLAAIGKTSWPSFASASQAQSTSQSTPKPWELCTACVAPTQPPDALILDADAKAGMVPTPTAITETFTYTVQSGDNLSKIAASFHTTVAAIQAANGMQKNDTTIYPKQVLKIPGKEDSK